MASIESNSAKRSSSRWAQPRPSTEGRRIPRFQVYRISAQTDCLLLWRLIRRDARGLNARSNVWGLKSLYVIPRAQGAAGVKRVLVSLGIYRCTIFINTEFRARLCGGKDRQLRNDLADFNFLLIIYRITIGCCCVRKTS